MIRGFVFIITLLTHGASFNHSNPTILLLHVCIKCITEIFIFVRRSRVLKNFEAGKTNFIIRQTVAGPGRARAARDDKTFALNSSLLMRENYV